MKTKNLLEMLFLLIVSFGFVSCNNDDEIDINRLVGRWSVSYDDPRLMVDGSVIYTFNTDKSCSIYNYDALSNRDTTINRTYIISYDNTLITLFNEEEKYTEQYRILKLTSKEMRWEDASSKCGCSNSNKKFVKVTE